ncbi:hypothetical protein [Novosphingopyxis sp. YJ-S2-01]|uniref:hypothetical protein n=1 Tax=Novosphingopyxis sp. YJ-S2-01 TaxID=2794021 RepID=UPI0018DBBFE9|nr:hypothetical protein [Novosphingopyxis sp. YJ-S2-01]MBH9537503.1 hypothetical protein [Novosphingopyxis sp. YJ-S2-01]
MPVPVCHNHYPHSDRTKVRCTVRRYEFIPVHAPAKIAALFVEKDGCYYGLPNVDPWDRERDARTFSGGGPVIAHPPCERWGAMAAVNYARWGGEHNRPGNDGGCFKSALQSVRRCGGVLEHPAKSRAFKAFGIPKPVAKGWNETADGWVCEVWQSAYGHRANKATWLYYVGKNPPFELDWSRPKGTHQVGFHDQRGKSRNKPTLPRSEARATPLPFRDTLIALAAHALRQSIDNRTHQLPDGPGFQCGVDASFHDHSNSLEAQ